MGHKKKKKRHKLTASPLPYGSKRSLRKYKDISCLKSPRRVQMPYTKYYTHSWFHNGCSEGTMQLVLGGGGEQYHLLRELDESRCWRLWSPGGNGIYAGRLKRRINLWLSLPVCSLCSAYYLYALWCMVLTMLKIRCNTWPQRLSLKGGGFYHISVYTSGSIIFAKWLI